MYGKIDGATCLTSKILTPGAKIAKCYAQSLCLCVDLLWETFSIREFFKSTQ
jgi:hypothetical protein